jgi:transcriptional regulator with XRE-family HTH domain
VNLQDLLNAAKDHANLTTDKDLAHALGVTKQAVSNWRQGAKTPDAVACEKLANLSGFPLPKVLGIAGEQRAISTAEKKVWRKLASAVFVSLVFVAAAQANPNNQTNGRTLTGHFSRHYAKLRKLLRRAWHRLTPDGRFWNPAKDLRGPSPVLA